jgi:hypothetical protein
MERWLTATLEAHARRIKSNWLRRFRGGAFGGAEERLGAKGAEKRERSVVRRTKGIPPG